MRELEAEEFISKKLFEVGEYDRSGIPREGITGRPAVVCAPVK